MTIDLVIDQHGRSHVTGTDAVGQLKGKFAIVSGLTGLNSDFIGHAFDDYFGVLQITRDTFANSDDVSAQRPR